MSRSILDYIPESPNRISMKRLAEILGTSDREARVYISDARINGDIVAFDEGGYYIPSEPSDLVSYYVRHRKRALTSLRSLKAVRRALKAAGVDVREIEGRNSKKGRS